jgi:hypothetical protein
VVVAVPGRPTLRILAALGLVTACTLAFQVIFTRLVATVLAYHFTFLAISLALLGTGAGALFLYLWPAWFERGDLEAALARWATVYGALLVLIPFPLVRIDLSTGSLVDIGFVLNLFAVCVLATLPSFAAGVVVALAIRGYAQWIGPVYAWDLIGAGIGALVVVPVLWLGPAPVLLVGLGAVAACAAALFGLHRRGVRLSAVIVAGVAVGVMVLSSVSSVLYLPPHLDIDEDEAVERADLWTPLARVLGYELPGENAAFAILYYDRVYAPVKVVEPGEVPGWPDLGTGPQSIAYDLTGNGRVLVVGGGGGRDIWTALSAGQERVDVIELNEGIRQVVDNNLADVSGRPYSRPRVHTTIGDGRSILSQSDAKYDVIHLGFTDTLSASAAQGYAFSENSLYTIEAFDEYFDHLTPNGILDVSRRRKLVGKEAVRATVLTLAALTERGIDDPERNVVVVRGTDILGEQYGTILARLRPWTAAELTEIRRLAEERGDGIAYAPGGPYFGEWNRLARADDYRDFCNSYRLNVCPPTDDKPFFFNMQRLSHIGIEQPFVVYTTDPFTLLVVTLGILLALCVVGFVLPLIVHRFRKGGDPAPSVGSLTYFAALGLGFLLLEIVLIQRFVLFLGFPTYALSVVLFSLLVFTGIGSMLSSRLPAARGTLVAVLGTAVALIVVGAWALPELNALITLPFAWRVVVAIAALAPTGLVLGICMPIGLRRFVALWPSGVAYAWGVNGIASVLASVLGVFIAINFGFFAASLAAAACYAFAMLHALIGRWPEPSGGAVAGAPAEPAEAVVAATMLSPPEALTQR